MNPDDANALCLECGLCCNGVIFGDVELWPRDDANRLRRLGVALKRTAKQKNAKVLQPCTAFENGCCRIYGDRPSYCQEFECRLLQRVKAGELASAAASAVIRSTLAQVQNVKQLLHELGDTEESLALGKRFQRMQKRLETNPSGQSASQRFGELSVAMLQLNVRLSGMFYPG